MNCIAHQVLLGRSNETDETSGPSGYMTERRNSYTASVGKHDRQTLLKDLGVNFTVILKWIFKN
jgi:hypothetical protein